MPTQAKIEKVAELRERVQQAAGIYLAEYKGLNVKDVSQLRQQVRKNGAEMIVIKNRLLNLAVEGTAAEGLKNYLKGPNAVFFCDQDPVTPAKTIAEFARTHDVVTWKGGYIDGTIVDGAGMGRVAEMPSKQELLAAVVGGISAPVSGLVFTLSGLVSDLVFTLESVADKKKGVA
jgi:large subunit ribosomal protein L10